MDVDENAIPEEELKTIARVYRGKDGGKQPTKHGWMRRQ